MVSAVHKNPDLDQNSLVWISAGLSVNDPDNIDRYACSKNIVSNNATIIRYILNAQHPIHRVSPAMQYAISATNY